MTRLCMRLLALGCAISMGCGDDDAVLDAGDAVLDAGDAVLDAGDAVLDAGFEFDAAPDAPSSDAPLADVAVDPDAGPIFEPRLSETGLYEADGETLSDGVRTFDVRYPLWSDGAEKQRFLWLPPGTAIRTLVPDHWNFPIGTKLWKEFRVGGVRVETRLLHKTGPEAWTHVAYVWRDDETDADVAPEGQVDARGTDHDVPSTAQCITCHRGSRDFVLGVSAFELAQADFDAMLAEDLFPPDAMLAEPPGDEVARAGLGYLHGNCGCCHADASPVGGVRSLRARLLFDTASVAETPFVQTALGQPALHEIGGTMTLLVAGEPDRSQLYVRTGLRGDLGMPPLGSEVVDDEGRMLLRAFIEAL